jgi:hypothetical protein
MKKGRSGVAALADFFTRHFGFRLAAMRGRDALEPFMAGYQSGDVKRLRRGGEATTTFHCNAPGGVLVEVATSG